MEMLKSIMGKFWSIIDSGLVVTDEMVVTGETAVTVVTDKTVVLIGCT